ncbi:hypothetical protein JCM6882_008239 [Rhodosporidiobolus microsporus]
MGFIKPATPGTLVVGGATVLLILVSVSTPLLKSIWFLRAELDLEVSGRTISGDATLGAWGYCVGDTCTSAKLGYSLDIAQLLGINGRIAGISTSVLKWITYLMILHPIAAAFGVVSTIFGLLAHMHNFAGTALTTCFASFAATFALLAFIFDIVVFVIAKKRIESTDVGGSAELGNAIWMTLAAMIMYTLSGCFFGFGACVIRKRRAGREASEKYRPQVDEEYGAKMRADAISSNDHSQYGMRKEGTLPNFSEHDRNNEQIPLSSMPDGGDDDNTHGTAYQPVRFASQTDVGAPSIVSGVGEGYGRRNPAAPGMPVSFSAVDTTSGGYSPPIVGGGAASRLGAEARANRGRATSADEERLNAPARQGSQTTEPFTGMYGHDDGQMPQGYSDPYAPSTSPAPGGAMAMPVPNVATSPTSQHFTSPTHGGAYPPYPSAPASGYTAQPTYPQPEKLAYPGAASTPSPSPGPSQQQQQQQQYYVQNHHTGNSAFSHQTGGAGTTGGDQHSIAPTYYTHDQHAGGGGGYQAGTVPPIPEMPYGGQGGSSADMYGTPYAYGGGGGRY